MTIDWLHFLFALLLLWLPRQVLRLGRLSFGRHHRRTRRFHDTNPTVTRQPGDLTVSFFGEFGKPRNYIDLLRGGLGGVALVGGLPGISPAIVADVATGSAATPVLALTILVLMIGVVIQALRLEGRVRLYAPIFYLGGLSIALCGPLVALFAWMLIWTINMALPNPTAFLVVYALVLAVFTGLFRGLGNSLAFLMAALCFLPALASLLMRRPLAVFAKKTRSESSSPA